MEIWLIAFCWYSEQFSDLQPRVYKTYIEALGDDKSLVTVYGGIIGLTALGYAVVKSLLVQEYLPQIHNRLVQFKDTNYPNAGVKNGGPAIKSEFAADPGGNSSTSDQHVGKKAKLTPKDQAAAEKKKTHDFHVDMCRMALLKALGWYVVTSMKLPRIGITAGATGSGSGGSSGVGSAATSRLTAKSSLPVCDLEEALVPYYVSASSQVSQSWLCNLWFIYCVFQNYYCRLMI